MYVCLKFSWKNKQLSLLVLGKIFLIFVVQKPKILVSFERREVFSCPKTAIFVIVITTILHFYSLIITIIAIGLKMTIFVLAGLVEVEMEFGMSGSAGYYGTMARSNSGSIASMESPSRSRTSSFGGVSHLKNITPSTLTLTYISLTYTLGEPCKKVSSFFIWKTPFSLNNLK